jgi:pimeloyl-ACP methyl ester carboxylesterase
MDIGAQIRRAFTSRPPSSPPDPAKLAHRPSESHTHTLAPSARKIGYAFYGSTNPTDPVVFMFHGLPGSRLTGRGWDSICRDAHIRLIALDRPGYGLSSPAPPGWKVVDWAADVLAVADALAVQRFSVLGGSGGGPYALACAAAIPGERLKCATVVCGIGPVESLTGWRLGGVVPWVLGAAARGVMLPGLVRPYVGQDAVGLKRVLEGQLVTEEERKLVLDTESDWCLDNSIVALLEAFKQGNVGCMHDGTVLTGDWGFELGKVDGKKVRMVHGDQDVQAPLYMAQWIDERLGGGRLRVLEGKTHFTIWKEHSAEIFRECAEG